MPKVTFSPKANTATSAVVPQPYTEVFPKLYSETQTAIKPFAVFLVGGPGSGKDVLIKRVFEGYNFVEIGAEKVAEFLTGPQSDKKKLTPMTELRQRLALEQRQGILVNGSADDADRILQIKSLLETAGYATAMTFVTTTNETSCQRNRARGERGGRMVQESVRQEKWNRAQASRDRFVDSFGDQLYVFDNSYDLHDVRLEQIIRESKSYIDALLTGASDQSQTLSDATLISLTEMIAASGLRYYGFGRYGKQGIVTHELRRNELVEIRSYPRYSINGPQVIEEHSETEIDHLAKKHGVTHDAMMAQLEMGIKVEHEHTKDDALAMQIALDHLKERPDYYTRLKQMEKTPVKPQSFSKLKKKMQETSFGYDEMTPQQWGPDKDEVNLKLGGQASAPVKRRIFLLRKTS